MVSLSDYTAQRNLRRVSKQNNGTSDKEKFWDIVDNSPQIDSREVFRFLKRLEVVELAHPGLTSAQYMAHCYRVASLIARHHHAPNFFMLCLGLCHNIFEIGGRSKKVMSAIGLDLADKVSVLTVDRSKQWEWNYKDLYYNNISRIEPAAVVKVFDKLDNIYLLSDNPNAETKLNYLNEINRYVIPLAKKHTPAISETFTKLYHKNLQLLN
jgi:(p)ppGpp synthase/HD superfamily hydrolase